MAMDGVKTKIETMSTETGVKDKFLMTFIDRLRKLGHLGTDSDPIPELSPEQEDELRWMLRTDMPEELFNPSLRIPGKHIRVINHCTGELPMYRASISQVSTQIPTHLSRFFMSSFWDL